MKSFPYHSNEDSFTLVELLVVIGILAILTAAVVIVLNPAELLKQSRDSKRTTDLASLNNAIKLLLTQNPDVNLGSASTVYVSLPANDASCSNILSSLPSIPAGWQYRCTTAANLTKVDSTGWVPVSFSSAGGVASLPALPIDPQNSGAYYYSYIPGGSWEISALFESKKYAQRAQSDAGIDPERLEVGSNLALWKDAYGLVGRWSLAQKDEKLGAELLVNNDVEGTYSGGIAPSWGTWDSDGGGNYAQLTSGAQSGSSAQQLNYVPGGGTYRGVKQTGMLSDYRRYKISFWAKSSVAASSGIRISDSPSYWSKYFDVSTEWNRYEYVHTKQPSYVNDVVFGAVGGSARSVSYDNLSIREVKTGDLSPNGNDGSVMGTAYSSDQQGNASGATSFNGAGDYVLAPLSSSLSFSGKNKITAMAWIKLNEIKRNPIISQWATPTFAWLFYAQGNQLLVAWNGGGAASDEYSTSAMEINAWKHVAFTYDGSNVKFYINGSLDSSYTDSFSIGGANDTRIGANQYDSGYTNGSLADVRLYNRALSAAEIQAIYNATK